jgi:2-succinyl-5-enolpyruvyl-6-hydroxy-3-cyclohexene-1-carboxylate synthase
VSDITNQQVLHVAVGTFVDELVRSGIRHFCVCPGSRSAPLALMIARHPEAKLWVHLDERSGSFFGLGLAKLLQEPVALVCTSGTAAANFMPAVIEAFYARVPLIVLTADRPHELRDCGALQTINQLHLFGTHAKWFVDLPDPTATPEMVRYLRSIARRAVATAQHTPAGPVHINCPYREPLLPEPGIEIRLEHERPNKQPYINVAHGLRRLVASEVDRLAEELKSLPRGLIICGPQNDLELPNTIVQLAEMLGYPILADPLSNVRSGTHERGLALDCYDAFLRDEAIITQLKPQVVLRFGAIPISKALLLYLQRHQAHPRPPHIVVDDGAIWNDPPNLATDVVQVEALPFCEALIEALRSSKKEQIGCSAWANAWTTINRLTRETITAGFSGLDELFDGKVFAELATLMPDDAILYVGNSMPTRDMDTFFSGSGRKIRFLANRGANGIDGVVSSGLGASAADDRPLVLVLGDVSFYCDTNGLLAAAQYKLNATIIVINNDGGGIFSFLPQANTPEFETLFGTPHGLNFQPIAGMYGAAFTRVTTWDDFRAAVQTSINSGGLSIVEVPTERNRNVTLHREVWKSVSEALKSSDLQEIIASVENEYVTQEQ